MIMKNESKKKEKEQLIEGRINKIQNKIKKYVEETKGKRLINELRHIYALEGVEEELSEVRI